MNQIDYLRISLIDVRGTVTIDSVLGKGSTFTIRLPLTLSICKALCCVSNHARIGFSMDGVEDMKDFRASDIQIDREGRRCVFWQNTLLPFQPLSELLSYNRQLSRGSFYTGKQEQDSFSIVILRGGNNLLAVQVDQVIGEQEIVIKQIEGPIPKTAGIAGATVLGDGTVMPVGDVLELIDIARGRLRADNGSPWHQPLPPVAVETSQKSGAIVLIVDDSITVRELLSLSFSKAGYRVEQARDGQEAWEKLRGGLPCDIVFCDIEMPRMNGLELLYNLQKDPQLASIPVALLTSRGAEAWEESIAGAKERGGMPTRYRYKEATRLRRVPAPVATLQEFVGVDGEAGAAFRARVVLGQNGPEPLDHGVLDLRRTGRSAVDDVPHMVDRIAGLDLIGQGQEPLEHDRHEVEVGHLAVMDRPEDMLGVPLVDEDQGRAGAHGGADIESQGCGVIGGACAHLDRGFAVVAAHQVHGRGCRHGHGAMYTLGTSRGAGGVHHGVAEDRVVDVAPVEGVEGGLVVFKALDPSGDRQADQ